MYNLNGTCISGDFLVSGIKAKWIPYYLKMAHEAAELSECTSLKVGCLALTETGLLSIGINGTVPKWHTNCAEDVVDGVSKTRHAETLHAEQNMIMKLASSTQSGLNSTVFCTDAPCGECAKLLAALGVKALFFSRLHKRREGLDLLQAINMPLYRVIDTIDGYMLQEVKDD